MKRTALYSLFSLALLLGANANAETLKILGMGGQPGMDEPQFMGMAISPNGRYVAGAVESGEGMFVTDIDNDEYKFLPTVDENEGALLVNVDNQGTAVGYDGPGVTYNIDGVRRTLVPGTIDGVEYRDFIAEGITADGKMIVGSLVAKGSVTYAAYTEDGGETFKLLPAPAGQAAETFGKGSSAKHVSVDGKYILGFVASYRVGALWERNDDGEYVEIPLANQYCVFNKSDELKGEKRLLSLFTLDLSPSGQFAAFRSIILDETGNFQTVPAIYDTFNKKMIIYDEKQKIDEQSNVGLSPSAIADTGTFVGTVGVVGVSNCATFIMYAGQTQAKLFKDEFPEFNGLLGAGDEYGFSWPTSMSADGSRIVGFTYYCDDYMDPDTFAYYTTYVLERVVDPSEFSSVKNIETEGEAVPVGYYSIDGKRMSKMSDGLNIIRMSDGSVRKIMK